MSAERLTPLCVQYGWMNDSEAVRWVSPVLTSTAIVFPVPRKLGSLICAEIRNLSVPVRY
jgi:hypothetical protein